MVSTAGEQEMFNPIKLDSLLQMPTPLLTAYVRTASSELSQHALTPEYISWLHREGRALAKSLPSAQRASFLEQLARIEKFLRQRTPHERSVVIFAGPSGWESYPLQTSVEPEIHWGKPSLGQLFWLTGEHKACGVAVIDHSGVKFLEYRFGELLGCHEKTFSVDISQWKKKESAYFTGGNSLPARGIQHDAFDKRVQNQFARLCGETAREAAQFCSTNALAALFIVGPSRLVQLVKSAVPLGFPQPVILIERDLSRSNGSGLLKHVKPAVLAWERSRQAEFIAAVANGRNTVVGIDETLGRLQEGRVRTLLLTQSLRANLHQCTNCAWIDRSADPVCQKCGAPRKRVSLAEVLPGLTAAQDATIEVVSGPAAERLQKTGGMAGWLRQPKRTARKRR
jgi:hypothetical protein